MTAGLPGRARLLAHQVRYDQKTFRRDPAAVFFTLALPLMFLVIFASLFGNHTTSVDGRLVRSATYQVPGIIVFAVVSATMVNLAVTLTAARERGTLKRVRVMPLPAAVFLAARVVTAILVTFLAVLITVGLGWAAYGVDVPGRTLPGLLASLVIGAAAFCCLGFALSTAIPSENAAPAIASAIVMPLYFISAVFIPEGQTPPALLRIADVFPIRHFFQALFTAVDPGTRGPGLSLDHLAVVAAWGVAALLFALARFRWMPHAGY